jgi:tetratricopeptide (TPR) repeat protein
MSFDLQSEAHDHARAYQLARGRQLNVENMYLGGREMLPSPLSSTLFGALVRESDPLELGVHRASIVNGNAVPAYVARDVDEAVARKLNGFSVSGGFLLVVGDSTAGKSRVAYEALSHSVPDHRLVAPYDRDELRYSLAAIATSPEKYVLWLDNIERFIAPDGLTPRIASHLKYLKVITVGSMRTEHYRKLSRMLATNAGTESGTHNELIASEYVLKQADIVFVERRWSPAEKARAEKICDARVSAALQHGDTYGIAEYLAAGPMLYQEWRLAGEAGQNPRGAAIVAAAIDSYRAGLHDFVPLEMLRTIHEHYLDAAGGPLLRPEPFGEAITWATQRLAGVSSLIMPGKDGQSYRAFDYLTDRIMLAADEHPIPKATWDAVYAHVKGDNYLLEGVALAAALQDNYELAESIWQGLVTEGHGRSAYNLGHLYSRMERLEDARQWYIRAVDLGYLQGALTLGHLAERSENSEEAASWYERAAVGGNAHGMHHLGLIARNRGREEQAEEWFRKALENEELEASSALGELLVASGRLEEAEATLRTAVDRGDEASTVYLGIVLANLGRLSEAEGLWLKAAAAEVSVAEANLGRLCWKQGRYSEAEQWYEKAVEHGVDRSLVSYAAFLNDRGHHAKARRILQRAIDSGDTRAYRPMGAFLVNAGHNRAEGIKWLKKAIEQNDYDDDMLVGLADALANIGQTEEARKYWQRLADSGNDDAFYCLGRLKKEAGELDEAAKWLEKAAGTEDAVAACQLAQVYRVQKKYGLMEKWLKKSLDKGHSHAGCLLGNLYNSRGDFERAEIAWRRGYEAGHRHLASELATLLAREGRGREAAQWLSRAKHQGAGGRSSKGRKPRSKGRGRGRRTR